MMIPKLKSTSIIKKNVNMINYYKSINIIYNKSAFYNMVSVRIHQPVLCFYPKYELYL